MYSLDDLESMLFYERTVEEVKKSFLEVMEIAKEFNVNLGGNVNVTPVKAYCPIEKKEVEFPYPFALHIKKLYAFVTGKYDAVQDIKNTLKLIKNFAQANILDRQFVQTNPNDKIMRTRLGFMMVLAEKRISLLEGESLTAYDLALLVGITNQGVVNKIRRGHLDADKIGVAWRIENEIARDFIREREHPFYTFI